MGSGQHIGQHRHEPGRQPPREAESTKTRSFWEVGQYEEIEMEPSYFLS